MKKKLAVALAVLMGVSSFSFVAGAEELEETGELTLYYSNSTDWADPLIEECENQTGINVSLVQDGTSSLFARIKAEAERQKLLAEQIYRGFKIMRGEAYHK